MNEIDLSSYDVAGTFDEMMDEKRQTRAHYTLLQERIKKIGWEQLNLLQQSTDRAQLSLGMTFYI